MATMGDGAVPSIRIMSNAAVMYQAHIQIGPESRSFEAAPDRSLLDLALENGVPVAYSCKRGDCGQCIGTLQRGRVVALNASQSLRVKHDIYLCNAAACSDVDIRLPYFPELANVPSLRSPSKIHELNQLSDKVLEVVLRLPPATRFRFLPGQFIRLTNKDRITRSYSLAAGPAPDRLLRLHVKRVEGGAFSEYLFKMAKPGDLLQLEGPQGYFFLREAHQAKITIFLATGTGIAPIYAMLSSLPPERRAALGEIHVYWGNPTRSEEYLNDALRTLATRLDFCYWALHSRETCGPRHVQDLMAEHHASLVDCEVFACGSSAMIDAARERSVELGLALDRFHSDAFTAS